MTRTSPTAPESTISRNCQNWGRLRQASPQAKGIPRARQVSTMRSASARVEAIGFSEKIAPTPASAQSITA